MPDPEFRNRWRQWVAQTLGGSEEQIEAATRAAMEAIKANSSREKAVQAARSAWGSHTQAPSGRADKIPAQALGDVAATPVDATTPVPRGRFRGRVAGFQQRFEVSGRRNILVWDFRVERKDSNVEQTPVAVEMRGFAFEGSIVNGDEVEIVGQPIDRKVLHVSAAYNLTSHALVRVSSTPTGNNFLRVVAAIIMFGFFFLFFSLLYNMPDWLPRLVGR
jgi:hypothetical protein